MSINIIILAAGKGTRMKSALPKVLQPIAQRPLLWHVLNTAKQLPEANIITIYGHGGEQVKATFAHENITWVEQTEQLGTGHAVQMTLPVLPQNGLSLILYGDVPLVQLKTLQSLIDACTQTGISMISLNVDNPTGYGRIIRKNGKIQAIVEHKDATEEQRLITEINTGIYCVKNEYLHQWLPQLSNQNAQNEYYLTDIIAMAVENGLEIHAITPEFSFEVDGVNDRLQLAQLERQWQHHQAQQLMKQGVHLIDPNRFDLRGTLKTGQDVRIDINVIIEGECEIGDNVEIGMGCIIKDSKIASNTIIQPYSLLDQVHVGQHNRIGPFARLRPQTKLADHVHIGNFVETKNTKIANGSKANHLTYLGDAEIGQQTNIGAGTITANYDGVHKYKTLIGNEVRIGSNSVLIAPVTIHDRVTIGGGSVINRNCEAGKLVLARAKQVTIDHWVRPEKTNQ